MKFYRLGGEGGIRTLEGLAPLTVFETAPFNHSGTSPHRPGRRANGGRFGSGAQPKQTGGRLQGAARGNFGAPDAAEPLDSDAQITRFPLSL